MSIRRFDVFATHQYLMNLDAGMSEDDAQAEGIWLAKVVAARMGGRGYGHGERRVHKVRELGGKPQTAKHFMGDVVGRMGEEFFKETFVPAVREQMNQGLKYKDFRDLLVERFA
jgi:hypothetical protein